MKVRWTTRCAGGCGRLLVVGSHAVRAHRTLWCPSCYAGHAVRCGVHRAPAPAQVPEREPALF